MGPPETETERPLDVGRPLEAEGLRTSVLVKSKSWGGVPVIGLRLDVGPAETPRVWFVRLMTDSKYPFSLLDV